MKRTLGSLGAADLGRRIVGESAKRTIGVPKPCGVIDGWLASVHHAQVEGVAYTHALVKIQRTAKQMKDREPDHREIGGTSDTEVEVAE